MTTLDQKNRRTAWVLVLIASGIFIYSYHVVRARGQRPEPANMTPAQKILRGL